MLSIADQNEMMQKYKALYLRKYNIELSDQVALAKSMLLLEFWKIIRRPDRKQDESKNS